MLVLIAFSAQALRLLSASFLPNDATVPLRYLSMMVQTVVLYGLPAFIYISQARGIPMPVFLEKRSLKVRPLLLTALMAVFHQYALILLTNLVASHLQASGQAFVPVPLNASDFVLGVIALCVLPAICEESLFRRGVFPSLQREFSDLTAIFSTALLFALMHGQLAALPAHFFVGLVLTYLVFETKSLIYPVVYHFVFNLVSLFVSACGNPLFIILSAPMLAIAVICLLLFLGIVPVMWIQRPRRPFVWRRASLGAVLLLCLAFLLLLPNYVLPLLS
jgi:CAAX amino terminal protease family.